MNKAALALDFIKRRGSVRLGELMLHGVSASTVRVLCNRGLVIQTARGVYADPDINAQAPGLHRDISDAWVRTGEQGVVALITAGQVHGLTDESSRVTIALPRNAAIPSGEGTENLAFVRWSDRRMFEVGVETVRMCGVDVRVTGPARTVADMFRRRNRQFRPDATNMLGQYVREGHDLSEIRRIAAELGFLADVQQELAAAQEVAKWDRIHPMP